MAPYLSFVRVRVPCVGAPSSLSRFLLLLQVQLARQKLHNLSMPMLSWLEMNDDAFSSSDSKGNYVVLSSNLACPLAGRNQVVEMLRWQLNWTRGKQKDSRRLSR